ncbi:PEP-CTERM sorting domain-containing protein [Chitiniphilus eburneus]|uniref:PEP-CTERM sorting domain-containing protein n=1 Tax=Chitiniphilus eburneus TaxID=2571148 RepID=A0A4U0Q1F9_9NEIS|nr:PEP-CTERM sorting domain-containing protein [Chitiniphilus eburneus]TJZ74846.1 PEP-CTERM sorting domain-containing protein [Chitiniphilus eburneus]
MKRFLCAITLGCTPFLAHATVLDLQGMLRIELDGNLGIDVSQANVVRDHYSFLETTITLHPSENWTEILPQGDAGFFEMLAYNVNGYAISGIHATATGYSLSTYHYVPAELHGLITHDRNGSRLLEDWGHLESEWSPDPYEHIAFGGIAPYDFTELIGSAAPASHQFGLTYSYEEQGWAPPNGWGYANVAPPTLTFTLYDPRSLVLSPVPEPTSYALFGVGLLALWGRRARRKK